MTYSPMQNRRWFRRHGKCKTANATEPIHFASQTAHTPAKRSKAFSSWISAHCAFAAAYCSSEYRWPGRTEEGWAGGGAGADGERARVPQNTIADREGGVVSLATVTDITGQRPPKTTALTTNTPSEATGMHNCCRGSGSHRTTSANPTQTSVDDGDRARGMGSRSYGTGKPSSRACRVRGPLRRRGRGALRGG